jgi:hypothetical protein
VIVDPAVAQKVEQTIDFVVVDRLAQSYVVDVRDWHQHGRVVGNDPQMKEPTRGTQNSFFFDPFDDAESMVRVDDLVT